MRSLRFALVLTLIAVGCVSVAGCGNPMDQIPDGPIVIHDSHISTKAKASVANVLMNGTLSPAVTAQDPTIGQGVNRVVSQDDQHNSATAESSK
jgi:hypothetical protein